eukprot:6214541-Pleurochrysis_carterae.AAC.2
MVLSRSSDAQRPRVRAQSVCVGRGRPGLLVHGALALPPRDRAQARAAQRRRRLRSARRHAAARAAEEAAANMVRSAPLPDSHAISYNLFKFSFRSVEMCVDLRGLLSITLDLDQSLSVRPRRFSPALTNATLTLIEERKLCYADPLADECAPPGTKREPTLSLLALGNFADCNTFIQATQLT